MGSHSPVVFSLGWEAGDHRVGQSGTPVGAVQATGARTGSYGLWLDIGDAWTSQVFAGVISKLGGSFSFFMDGAQQTGQAPHLFSPCGNINSMWHLRVADVSGNRRLQAAAGDMGTTAGATIWTGGANLSIDTLYIAEFYTYNPTVGIASSWPFRVKLYNNSGTLLDDSGWQYQVQTESTIASTNSVSLGPGHNTYNLSGTHEFVYDDLIVYRGPPAEQGRIIGVAPTGNSGTDNTWSAGTGGNKWDEVDEIGPDDDTSYIFSPSASGSRQGFTHGVTGIDSTAGDDVLAVNMVTREKEHAAGNTRIVQQYVRSSSGASTPYGSIGSTGSYAYLLGAPRQISPGGNPWTASDGAETDVDNLEFGLITSVGSGQGRVTQHLMEVAYTEIGDFTIANWKHRQRGFV